MPAPPPEQAPEPPAPKLLYLGKRHDETGWQVFVQRGEQALILREGQVFDQTYRVESIKPPRMVVAHVAQGRTFEVAIGEAQ
ncbi:MAG: hypothetical protein KIT17_00490 [Rubrivivax sp.]|nr:hypothetical protein [Rubrivivax sp.]